ncbi:hypothetical protein Gogos_006739, partial [Gossypium gossypioides]|nr:hypothetical protein [Gossypium gossypioides]
HISPLLKLSIQIAAHGIKVTFVTTEVEDGAFMETLPEEQNSITLISIPHCVDEDVRNDALKTVETIESIRRVIPVYLEDLIAKINQSADEEKISCVITDTSYAKFYDLILCNSVYELDSSVSKLIPNALPIGPLLAGKTWPQDSTCLAWLNRQPAASVIYVAFGSSTMASAKQVEELALGLELSGHPFLWVVRPNFMDGSTVKFPDGFKDRVSGKGKIIEWTLQEAVLAHPSVLCFVSHCGWNSTVEGVTMGVPFLCWPYIADQFSNKNYICNVLKTGLELMKGENGITTRREISSKINTLISSDVINSKALHVKDIVRKSSNEGGSSFKNFKSFIEHIKSL